MACFHPAVLNDHIGVAGVRHFLMLALVATILSAASLCIRERACTFCESFEIVLRGRASEVVDRLIPRVDTSSQDVC